MALRKILQWPDARLTEVCAPTQEVSLTLLADMFETMYAAPGRGLAAPQIGVMSRVFVMDPTWKDGDATPYVCINPDIIARSETVTEGLEACLSIPDLALKVARPAEITLRYTDAQGQGHEAQLTGFAARCAQHEMDHLDGITLMDRINA